jgi:hypothetical protein
LSEAPTHGSLAAALLAVQRDMPAIERDGRANYGTYTTLGHLLAKAKPVLTQHGVTVCQFPSKDAEGRPTLRTLLIHESGDNLESEALLSPVKNDPQSHGAALTYMRRYALAAALGISDQEDRDGETPGRVQGPKLEKAKVDHLFALIEKHRSEGMTFDDLALLMGSAGVDAPEKRSVKSVKERLRSLTDEQAAALEKELAA